MKTQLDIFGGTNIERDTKIDSRKLVNLYTINTPQGKNNKAIVMTPGTKKVLDFSPFTQVRALWPYKDYLYAVVNYKVYKIDSFLVPSEIGELSTSEGFVSIDENQNQLIFVDGAKGYIYNATTGVFSDISSPGFPTLPPDVASLDGYFVVSFGGENKFGISALNDGLTWDPLDFAYMQSQQDQIIAIAQLHRRIFFFGKKITEVWYDAGAADFPLRRDNNMLFQYGCAADGSVAIGGIDQDKRLFWLAGDANGIGSVMMSDGSSPERISTPAMEYVIQRYTNVQDATGIAYKIDGHTFYELSFTKDNATWIYNLTTKQWFNGENIYGDRKFWNCHAFFNNKHYVGSYNKGIIYETSSDYYDDDGIPIKREIISGHFADKNLKRTHITRVQLDMVSGTGQSNGEYRQVKAMISSNKDNKGFGNIVDAFAGTQGARQTRVIARRFGTARDWYFKFEFTTKNKVMIMSANIDYEVSGR